jgi:hypothetical protein
MLIREVTRTPKLGDLLTTTDEEKIHSTNFKPKNDLKQSHHKTETHRQIK